jgi:hypothetical protein
MSKCNGDSFTHLWPLEFRVVLEFFPGTWPLFELCSTWCKEGYRITAQR